MNKLGQAVFKETLVDKLSELAKPIAESANNDHDQAIAESTKRKSALKKSAVALKKKGNDE
jgi:hypothetical protein